MGILRLYLFQQVNGVAAGREVSHVQPDEHPRAQFTEYGGLAEAYRGVTADFGHQQNDDHLAENGQEALNSVTARKPSEEIISARTGYTRK